MMLADGDFRVSHVTTHVSLRKACDLVKRDRIRTVIQLTHDALLRMAIPSPRIAVAGLNPHAGEGGLFGTEEIDEIAPPSATPKPRASTSRDPSRPTPYSPRRAPASMTPS